MCRTRNLVSLILLLWAGALAAAAPPPVTLAERYDDQTDIAKYWVSEKFDGVRGYWTGKALITRGGTPVDPPAWFTAGWPDTPMDGELWIDYGEFARVSGIVRTHDASDPDWRQISYRVFDLPAHGGTFDARVPAISDTVAAIDQPWVVAIHQFKVNSADALDAALDTVLARGGEGLILHRGDTPYRAGRSDDLLKLKPYEDAEAIVTGINPGQGRLDGLMGSLDLRTPDGREFAVGSGFTDAERADPPPIGSWITYRYNGETATGLPRFARFLRRRPGGPAPEPGGAATH